MKRLASLFLLLAFCAAWLLYHIALVHMYLESGDLPMIHHATQQRTQLSSVLVVSAILDVVLLLYIIRLYRNRDGKD